MRTDRRVNSTRIRPHQAFTTFATLLLIVTAPPATHAQAGSGGTAASVTTTPLAFEVVSIKPHNVADPATHLQMLPDGVRLLNISLEEFIRQAYGLDFHGQLIGVPDWATSQHYDIEAKVAGNDAAAFKKLSLDQVRLMARPILADRFKLAAHIVQRPLPVYLLEPARGGPKLNDSTLRDTGGIRTAEGNPAKDTIGMGRNQSPDGTVINQMTGQSVSLGRLVSTLAQTGQDRPIIDRTGLTGIYDFKLKWTTAAPATSSSSPTEDVPPSIFTAIQEQLGLKLEPAKEPVPVLIVEHVERPSEN